MKKFEYFTDAESKKALFTYDAAIEVGYAPEMAEVMHNTYMSYWLRSIRPDAESSVAFVNDDGFYNGTFEPRGGCGVRPVCNISPDLYVTSIPDQDGAYILSPRKKMYIYRVDLGIYLYSSIDEVLLDKDGMYLLAADEQ